MFIPSRLFIPTMWAVTAVFVAIAFAQKSHADPREAQLELSRHLSHFTGLDLSQNSLPELDRELGAQGKTREQPWSGSNWPLYNGSVAYPYSAEGTNADRFSDNQKTFATRLARIRAAALAGAIDTKTLDQLSPTEKYDLYVGDLEFTLTQAQWKAIQEQEARFKGIEAWEGICHGWSTASAYVKRPKHKIVVPSMNGKFLIPFYPDDLKGLVTLLWANSLIQDYTRFEGLRCHTDTPRMHPWSGKVFDLRCKGVNPALWHLTVLTLVGQKHEPFIINKNNNREVWNQPVSHYELRYFNPKLGRYASLVESKVPAPQKGDPFLAYRGEATNSLVGVEMKIHYAAETAPDHLAVDGPATDVIDELVLRYDLELDANDRIIGGEWRYTEPPSFELDPVPPPAYPGFIWRFLADKPKALSIVDVEVPVAGFHTLPEAKRLEMVRRAANFHYEHYAFESDAEDAELVVEREELRPQPVASVVYPLIEWANR